MKMKFLPIFLLFPFCTSSRILGTDHFQSQTISDSSQQRLDMDSKCESDQVVELGYHSFAKLEAMFDNVNARIDSASGFSRQQINQTLERNGNQLDRLVIKLDNVGQTCNSAMDGLQNKNQQQQQVDCSAVHSIATEAASIKEATALIAKSFDRFEKTILNELNTLMNLFKSAIHHSDQRSVRRYPEFPNTDYCPAALDDGVYCFKWNSSCYCISTNRKSWTGAFSTCRKYNMNLVSLETAQENEEINRLLKRLHWNEPVWTSCSDLMEENMWMWTAIEQPVTYFNWHPGQPDSPRTAERFMHMNFFDRNGKWNNIPGTNQYGFVCEL